MCSNCGSIVKKTLSVRVHECPYCGFVADRDYNAAVNIHRVGMEQPSRACGDNTATSRHCDASITDDSQEAPSANAGVVHNQIISNYTTISRPSPKT
ncbi:MAG: zinc ribbon domain-containing protein [Methanoculleus sp.]